MLRSLALLALLSGSLSAAPKVLIVADEFPAMQALAARLKAGAGVDCDIVAQTDIPADFKSRPALIVYIHKSIGEPAEVKFIDYARSGGRLILLHHSISSGKRPNRFWFPFLGIELPQGDIAQGGYKYYEGITMELVNLAPHHYVTTHNLTYNRRVDYRGEKLPGFELDETEVYLNHVFTTPKHKLLGLKATDPKSGKVYMQDTAGWYQAAEKGWVFYFMAGHSTRDFDNPAYAQIVVNAFTWRP